MTTNGTFTNPYEYFFSDDFKERWDRLVQEALSKPRIDKIEVSPKVARRIEDVILAGGVEGEGLHAAIFGIRIYESEIVPENQIWMIGTKGGKPHTIIYEFGITE